MKCLGINLTQYYLYTKNYKTVLRGIYKEEKRKRKRESERKEKERPCHSMKDKDVTLTQVD